MSLKVENIGCERNDRVLFSHLSFDLGPGEVLQVDGPNGSGKTTLLRTVCGLLPLDEGDIYWAGRPIRSNRPEYFAKLAYVGHRHGIKDELTPEENLEMDGLLAAVPSSCSHREALDRLGVAEYAAQPCRELSAGQRQRVALARLLISTAALWVLDEPLTALDGGARDIVRAMLIEHAANGGMALVTSHQDMAWNRHPARSIRIGHG